MASRQGSEIRAALINDELSVHQLLASSDSNNFFNLVHPQEPSTPVITRVVEPVVYPDAGGAGIEFVWQDLEYRLNGATIPVFALHYRPSSQAEATILTKDTFCVVSQSGFGYNRELRTISVDRDLLAVSPNFLISLAFEMGRVRTSRIENELLRLLSSEQPASSPRLKEQLIRLYGRFGVTEYIHDLWRFRNVLSTSNPDKKAAHARMIKNQPLHGINKPLPDSRYVTEKVNGLLQLWQQRAIRSFIPPPVGLYQDFLNTVPPIHAIFDPMQQRLAWGYAKYLEDQGSIDYGFTTEAVEDVYVHLALAAKDQQFSVPNYTKGGEALRVGDLPIVHNPLR